MVDALVVFFDKDGNRYASEEYNSISEDEVDTIYHNLMAYSPEDYYVFLNRPNE